MFYGQDLFYLTADKFIFVRSVSFCAIRIEFFVLNPKFLDPNRDSFLFRHYYAQQRDSLARKSNFPFSPEKVFRFRGVPSRYPRLRLETPPECPVDFQMVFLCEPIVHFQSAAGIWYYHLVNDIKSAHVKPKT